MRFLVPLLLVLVAQTTLAAADLPTVLSKMNAAAAPYQGMTAKIRWIKYTKLVDDTDVESGDLWVKKDNKGQVQLRIAFTEPIRKQIRIEKTTVELFNEAINQIEEYDLKAKGNQLYEGLLLGYGVSGDDLKERYDIEIVAEEPIDGQSSVKLDMTPKDAEDRAAGKSVQMWISTQTWQPIQQKALEHSGDYRLISYSGVKISAAIKASDLALDLSRAKSKPKRVKTKL
ncbi:MAG: outer membrane lipoprotein carrier protein LolA [Acidobacteria bacterium]|nr:outer membrane lipoprotein carrier protein LolA [Acidobacteriota bacterium]MDA1233814.1 outer membrane lipoprotein carrier protein LolA [Acidobacteriota bacterium]